MPVIEGLDGMWIAVYVRANHERTVADQLQAYGYEPFLPMCSTPAAERRPRTPLFPGYVFCRYRLRPSIRIVQIPGVVRILSHGQTPAVLSADEIEAIRRIVSLDLHVERWRFLEEGQRVRITCGPLQGVEGTLIDIGNRLRMVVSVTMLRRSVAVTVDAEQLALLSDVA
jgi:transcriptional antiterminator NusG